MNKLSTLKEIYRKEGFRSMIQRSGEYVLVNSPLSPYLKRSLGKNYYHKVYSRMKLGYWPRIRDPRTFNEKVIHRKLYTDNDLFSVIEDKWRVREYVSERVGNDILPTVYHVTTDPDTIPFDSLPEEYVIKPTHLSGPVVLVDAGEDLDRDAVTARCREWLDRTHEMEGEYWYSAIEPQVLVEERLRDDEHGVPPDFKFFVFHGRVEYIQVDFGRFSEHTRRFYDREWTPQEFMLEYPLGPDIERPAKLDEMIDVAETLGREFEFIRIDLYNVNDEEIVFGEMTVAPASGGKPFTPRECDFELGALW